MKLSREQAVKLENLRETHAQLSLNRTSMRAEIERELEERLDVLYKRQSRLANECFLAGVSKTKIGRAMGTTDWKTITTILNATAAEFEVVPDAPAAGKPYRLEGVDEGGSPSAVVLEVYRDRASGEMVHGPLTIPLYKMFPGYSRKISFASNPATEKVAVGYLYDVTLEINEGLPDPDDEPVRQASAAPDDYKARFFVPDDDGEDED